MMKKTAATVMLMMALGSAPLFAKVIATVDGVPITLKDANAFVKKVTQGRANYAMLKKKDRQRVIHAVATDKLIVSKAKAEVPKRAQEQVIVDFYVRKNYKKLLQKAKKALGTREKNMAIADLWVRKMSAAIEVTDEEAKEAYEKNKRFFKNQKTGKIAPFEKVKPLILLQLKQKKFVDQLMKKAKIEMGSKGLKKHAKTSSDTGSSQTYVVKSGDTLSGIAKRNKTSVAALLKANEMTAKSVIKVGQKLTIPSK